MPGTTIPVIDYTHWELRMLAQMTLPKPEPKLWNSRFVAYAKAHDKTPEAMLEHDTERYPGGKMCGFTFWIQDMWREWRWLFGPAPVKVPRLQGAPDLGYWDWKPGNADQKHFDEWLERKEECNTAAGT